MTLLGITPTGGHVIPSRLADLVRHLNSGRLTAAALVASAVLALGCVLSTPVDRDEHMHAAAARLLVDHALYTDLVFTHPPLSAWVQAAGLAVWAGPETLLPLRLTQWVIVLGLGAVLTLVLRRVGASPLLAGLLVLLLVHTQILRGSMGLARSHELALLLGLAPWILLPIRRDDRGRAWRLVLAGVLAALAGTTRLTHLSLTLLAVAWPLLAPSAMADGRRDVRWTALGAVFATAVVSACAWGPDLATLRFGLIDYHLLNARFHEAVGLGRGLSWEGKLRDAARFYRSTDLATWSILVATALVLVTGWARIWTTPRWRLGLGVVICGVLMVVVPRPIQQAYYEILLVGGMLLVAAAAAGLAGRPRRILNALVVLGLVINIGHHLPDTVRLLTAATHPSRWPARTLHQSGRRLAGMIPGSSRPVVTTHPLYVLEAGLPLDPAFSAGEFVWRLGETIDMARRDRLTLVTAASIDAHLAAQPPAAVIAVAAAPWDGPLSNWARRYGWKMHPLAGGVVVWMRDQDVR